jgi:hypothetical protein
MSKRSCCAALAIVALATACTSEDPSEGVGKDSAETGRDVSFVAPPKVRPPRIESPLATKAVKKCLEQERVDIASLAGTYSGPISFTADQVSQTRELDLRTPSSIDIVEAEEFKRLFDGTSIKIPPKERAINRWLGWAFGYRPLGTDGSLSPPGKNDELVAGFYDPSTENIVVRLKDELDGEYVILAHELAHAAVDQAFGPPTRSRTRVIDDEALAITSLIEGDATLTELRFSSRFAAPGGMVKSIRQILEATDLEEDRAEGFPHAILDRFVFPYRWGLTFICSVFQKRGWPGVNRIYAKPPSTTAEIMFPQRYLSGEKPRKPARLGKAPRPWKLFGSGQIGAAHLKALFEAPGDYDPAALSRPLARAAGWDGGRYEMWARDLGELETILGVSLVEHEDHPGLVCSSMIEWYKAAFNYATREVIADGTVAYTDPVKTAIISCADGIVRVGIAPDKEMAAQIVRLSL